MKTLYRQVCAIGIVLMGAACSNENTSQLRLDGDCAIEQLALDNYESSIDPVAHTVTVRLPETYNTAAMTVTALRLSDGARCNLTNGQTLNMHAAKNIQVTHGDLYQDWTLSVLHDEARISSFVINDIYTGIINQEQKTITVYVPKNIGLTALIPTISHSLHADCLPLSGVPTDFSTPVTYTISNGSAQSHYVVTVVAIDRPAALFVGTASALNELDPEARTACLWMLAHVPNSLYASLADIQAEAIDLSACKVIWWHYHKDGGVDGHDAFMTHAPQAIQAKNQLRTYYENGGSFLLTRYAVNLPSFIGATGADEWTTPNNCWGQNEDVAELCHNPWDFKIFDGQAEHPLYAGLVRGDDAHAVYCTDAGYHITNSTAQYHVGTDWGDYPNHDAWTARTGGIILGRGGDGAIVAWEYPAAGGKGGILCIGSGCYDWYSYTYEPGYVEKFHKNIAILTENAINYLTK